MSNEKQLKKINEKKPEQRAMWEVEFLRRQGAVFGGCCNRFADNQGCDCISRACDYKGPAMTPAGERHEVLPPIIETFSEFTSMDADIENRRKHLNRREMVNHPEHYGGDTPYECIKVLEAWLTREEFIGWLKGTIIKYQSRLGKKDSVNQDAAKCAWYSRYLEEFLKRTNK